MKKYPAPASKPKLKPVRKPAPALPADTIREIRYQALLAALDAAKLGLAHDVYRTADKYAAWLGGAAVEAPQLPFAERLKDLVDECKRSGEVDDALVLHDMQVVLGIPTVPPGGAAPDWIGGDTNAAAEATRALQEGRI